MTKSKIQNPNNVSSIYFHIPFCKKKCNYCDFVSYAGKEDLIERYVEALVKEITALTRQPLTFPPLPEGEGNSTIYFGGGTPTLLEPRHFETILQNVGTTFMVVRNRRTGTSPIPIFEITIEANPGTADKAKLKALRSLGINRLSIGAQSFNDRHLRTLGRIHTAEEALKFYDDARSAGFDNINLDLMFALPDQTFDQWKSDLKIAIDLEPNHLSTYNLQIEENTPLWEKGASLSSADKGLKIPTEETELAMYEYTIETLTSAGYKHYEISNFAKPGFECRHNINYWKNGNYIGIGAGAHSHVDGNRWSNPNCIEAYVTGHGSSIQGHRLETRDLRPATIFLGLRLLEGLPAELFKGYENEVSNLLKDGLLEPMNGNYRLTRQGLYLGNLVFENFI